MKPMIIFKYRLTWIYAMLVISLSACSESFDYFDEPAVSTDVALNDPINDFVWKALNSWYYWQPNSENLQDTKADDLEDYYNFLNQYSNYEELMLDLCYKHTRVVGSQNAVDRFSWFIPDYEVQQQSFQGIRTRFGFTSRMIQINNSTQEVIMSILMVEPGSPADLANIRRGDILYKIDGTKLNAANYDALYSRLANETVTLSFATEQNGVLSQLEDKTITRALVKSNPVHFTKVFDNIGGKKVGYLVYNQFSSSYNDELNDAFGEFKNQGINELVLDLRFNGGGSVLTSSYLASMIYKDAGVNRFVNLVFNEKHKNENEGYDFSNSLTKFDEDGKSRGKESTNRLSGINRLYILTSPGTASASELIINGLQPYISDITLIGATTYGKNVGSITLYDAPNDDYERESRANPNHKYAMQPIVFQTYNRDGNSDYLNGFSPDIAVNESQYWNNLLQLGDRNEALLKVALDDISGIQSKESLSKFQKQAKEFKVSLPEDKFDQEMYLDFIPNESD